MTRYVVVAVIACLLTLDLTGAAPVAETVMETVPEFRALGQDIAGWVSGP